MARCIVDWLLLYLYSVCRRGSWMLLWRILWGCAYWVLEVWGNCKFQGLLVWYLVVCTLYICFCFILSFVYLSSENILIMGWFFIIDLKIALVFSVDYLSSILNNIVFSFRCVKMALSTWGETCMCTISHWIQLCLLTMPTMVVSMQGNRYWFLQLSSLRLRVVE